MAKKPTITSLQSGFNSTETLNSNFEGLRDAFDNTLSLDGSTPNAMEADLDLNGNNLIGAAGLLVNGTDYLAEVEAAKAAALVAQAAAETAETNAETAEANAESSETAAGLSATAAATSATASQTAQTAAELAETNAETAESNAATSATNAATSETNASTSASTASTKATEAATSATNAATSEANAASSASSAQASKDAALAALDSFDDRYLGQKAADPTLDNDGDALVAGALYFNTTDDVMKVYEGSSWVAAYASLSGALLSANNLSDLADASTARTNLGLGTAATTASSSYATAAQGALADTATQPADLATVATTGAYSDLSGKPTLGTAAATASTDYATAAQGTLADSAVQPNDSPTFGTVTATSFSGDGSALTGLPAGYTNSDVDTHLNYSTATTGQVLSYSGSDYDWVDAASGATGGGSDEIFWENGQTVTSNYTITNGKNAMSAGPITINSGVTVTVGDGEVWTVV